MPTEMYQDDNDSGHTTPSEYTPVSRGPPKKKPSMNSRRNSRLLYIERYGLDKLDFKSQEDMRLEQEISNYYNDDQQQDMSQLEKKSLEQEYVDHSNHRPSRPVSMASASISVINRHPSGRPISIRNSIQSTEFQKRPLNYIKVVQTINSIDENEEENGFTLIHALMEKYHCKVYMEGYLYKRIDTDSKGKAGDRQWSRWYVELSGPILTLWNADKATRKEVYPEYINITDAVVNIEDKLTAESRRHLFSINSAGDNRYLFQANNVDDQRSWVKSMRLSCYECSRIQSIYTRLFIIRPQFRPILDYCKRDGLNRKEGYLQARFPGTTDWKRCWVVTSDKHYQRKHMFTKKRLMETLGHVTFYETKRSKHPFMTLRHVAQAYTVYPESPKLINLATLFKLEGSLYKSSNQLLSESTNVLLMTSTSTELAEWLVAIYDTFKLYGRPQQLLDDTMNMKSLNFAYSPVPPPNLFLDLADIIRVDVVDRHSHLLNNKLAFERILFDKISSPSYYSSTASLVSASRASSVISPILSKATLISSQTSRTSLGSSRSSVVISPTKAHPPPDGRTSQDIRTNQPTHLRRVIYASDASDTDEEDEIKCESSDGSVDTAKKDIPPPTSRSKSSSEVSEISSSTADIYSVVVEEPYPAKEIKKKKKMPKKKADSVRPSIHYRDSIYSQVDDDNIPIRMQYENSPITINPILNNNKMHYDNHKKMLERQAKRASNLFIQQQQQLLKQKKKDEMLMEQRQQLMMQQYMSPAYMMPPNTMSQPVFDPRYMMVSHSRRSSRDTRSRH
ncbi:hypothetical protein BDB01DRAFT_768816 [Pilobolus umbonatus]|nr:hypothetical protein BDB01DRAFT_768816 [Pilobolus umbonatus]